MNKIQLAKRKRWLNFSREKIKNFHLLFGDLSNLDYNCKCIKIETFIKIVLIGIDAKIQWYPSIFYIIIIYVTPLMETLHYCAFPNRK
jgi:hypothetical protein